MGSKRITLAFLCAFGAAACDPDAAAPDDPAQHVCKLASSTAAVQQVDRKILGAGAPYPADATLVAREAELEGSQAARRALGWAVVAKVLTPVPLAHGGGELPAWTTWYARDDLSRVFEKIYPTLSKAQRTARAHFDEAALDATFAWNVDALDELPGWPPERFQAYLDALDDDAKRAGVGGIARVGYSPSAARHLIAGYPELLACLEKGPPAPFADGPAEGPTRLVREGLLLSVCATRRFGPYFVAGGETLRATLDGASPGSQVIVRTAAGDAETCKRGVGEACEVAGPGAFEVVVVAGDTGTHGALEVDYRAAEPTWAACLQGAFPRDAAIVKADWRRVLPSMPIAVYDTSAPALARRMRPDGKFAWGEGDGTADPGPDDIYTATLASGNTYRLAALHIMTKELDHWVWVTLWWSPPAAADDDFGADRPAALAARPAWQNYKMCVATAFDERDPQARGGAEGTLGAALTAVYGGPGAPSWCSNPYLELGEHNAQTNCVGCHQHAGTGLLPEDILADSVRFPARGRVQTRNNFPADYAWSVDHGDRLTRLFADVVAYWDTAP
jgi:hypothetical protein